MDSTRNGLERLYSAKQNLEFLLQKDLPEGNQKEDAEKGKIDQYKDDFIRSMEDDLNTADGIAAVFDLVKYVNTNLGDESSRETLEYAYETLMELANVLGILTKKEEMLEEEIARLIEERNQARKNKDFQKSDQIRDYLKDKGIVLEDTRDGVKWKRL